MVENYLDANLAALIIEKLVNVIECNVNIMNTNGRIIGSSDPERIGKIHEGALLALAQKRIVNVDEASLETLQGVKAGINIPLRQGNVIVGVIGLTGKPQYLLQFSELVRIAAEATVEQAHLLDLLSQNTRLREELVLNIIRNTELSAILPEWATPLGIDLQKVRIAMVVDINSGQLDVRSAMAELRQLQSLIMNQNADDLVAIVSLTEIVILKSAYFYGERWEPEEQKRRMLQLHHSLRQHSPLRFNIGLGHLFLGEGGMARSYQTAKATLRVGKHYRPTEECYSYHDIRLPVLLESLHEGWQATELKGVLKRLKATDHQGTLLKTLHSWFLHDLHSKATSEALFIHKNTLDYRLKRISQLTGLQLTKVDDRFLLYAALQLDNQ